MVYVKRISTSQPGSTLPSGTLRKMVSLSGRGGGSTTPGKDREERGKEGGGEQKDRDRESRNEEKK